MSAISQKKREDRTAAGVDLSCCENITWQIYDIGGIQRHPKVLGGRGPSLGMRCLFGSPPKRADSRVSTNGPDSGSWYAGIFDYYMSNFPNLR